MIHIKVMVGKWPNSSNSSNPILEIIAGINHQAMAAAILLKLTKEKTICLVVGSKTMEK
jgi:hypothetical protein